MAEKVYKAIVTLVGNPLVEEHLFIAQKAVQDVGGRLSGDPDGLCDDVALDIFCDLTPSQRIELVRLLRQLIPTVDFAVQSILHRKKKLLTADMDSTMIVGESIDEMAALLGLKKKISAITARAMAGELDFVEALRERVGLLEGLSTDALESIADSIVYQPGARSLVATMRQNGARMILVSGGFKFVTSKVREKLGFHVDIGNDLAVFDGKLTGNLMLPLVDRATKEDVLREEAISLGITLAETAAVGDGANDIPMLKSAGLGVGYFGKEIVRNATPFQINNTDLKTILYFQGYKAMEIVI
jgi:phosphoserine phosphatase